MCAFVDSDEGNARFLCAPGSALRPAAWFPCVDDGGSLVHFSAVVRSTRTSPRFSRGCSPRRTSSRRRYDRTTAHADAVATGV